MKKLFIIVGIAAMIAAGGTGKSEDTERSLQVIGDGFRYVLKTPSPIFAFNGNSTKVTIESFGLTGEVGYPQLPVKIFKAAIPHDAAVSLKIIDSRVIEFPNLKIAPVPHISLNRRQEDIPEKKRFTKGKRYFDGLSSERKALPGKGMLYERIDNLLNEQGEELEDPAFEILHKEKEEIYSSVSPYPRSRVRLGKTGYIRHQKYIEIIFHPIIYYPAEQRALFFSEIEIEVSFQYLGATSIDTSLSYTHEAAFEKIYRQSFINYEQGKSYRIEGKKKEELILKGLGQQSHNISGNAFGGSTVSSENQQSSLNSFQSPTSSSIYKLKVSNDGIYRLDYFYIQSNANDLLTEDPRTFKLMNRGVEVPIYVKGESDGTFDPADYIEFYGQALTDEPKTLLNYDFTSTQPDIYQDNDFTDTNIYFLSAEAPSSERERMPTVDGYPFSGLTPPTDFLDKAHAEVDSVYLSLGENDPWYWGPRIRSTDAINYRDIDVELLGLSSLSHTAELNVKIRGTTFYSSVDPDHKTAITANGHSETRDEQEWDGETIFTHIKIFDQSYLTSTTTVRIEAMTLDSPNESKLNEIILDYVDIKYYRFFQAVNDSLSFQYDNGANQFDIENFSNSAVSIYEITNKVTDSNVVSATRIINPQITGSGTYTVSFEVANDPGLPPGDKRHFIVSSESSILTPDSCVLNAVSDLKDTLNQADIIVIGTPDTLDVDSGGNPTPGSPLDNLLNFRYSDRGLTSKVVMVEDIYDEFNNGLFDPNAIRYFLNYAYYNWETPEPSYVFIIGDGTYDYKNNYAQEGFKNYVPTQIMFQKNFVLGYYSSDNWLACFIGNDQLPDIHLGRISTRTISESNGVLDKIDFYERTPPAGNWKSHDIMISDEGKYGDPIETEEFEKVKNDQIDKWLKPPHSYQKIYYAKPPYNGTDNTLCRDDIKAAINGGAVILNYVGHGSFTRWSNDTIFHTDDVPTLANADLYPWLIASNCLTGGFHHATVTAIGENFVLQPNKGTVATFAPSGLSYTFISQTVEDLIFDDIYGPHKEIEVAIITYHVRDELHSKGSIVDLQSHTYLGDPVLDLVIPRPEPPTRPWDAVGGHEVVNLTWTASPDTSVEYYNIYRTINLNAEYTKIASHLPKTQTTYDDFDVVNMTTYYYAFTSEDAEGFESPYSNFNTDCDVNGPDCVKATPENPDPPAPPTGFDAVDPETGGKSDLSWNANSESDLKGYTVYWWERDFEPKYSHSKWVKKVTSYTLTGLENGVWYGLCVTATNTSEKESGYSNEVEEKPDYVPGLKPPKAISDLMVKRSSINPDNDLELTWSIPTNDIYDDPETISAIKIYRNTVPDFIPSDTNLITDPPLGPDTTSYTDAGAYSSPENYYYLVQSIDVDGNPSGVGREVPAAIEDMTIKKSLTTPGNIILSWGEITTDFFGDPSIIDHYTLYGSDTKFTREDIKNDLIPVIQDNITTTSIEITPAGGDRYYSVIVLDNRGNKSPY